MSGSWDPALYLKFTDHRLRPALDLMARVLLPDAATIYDLGCGPGNVTKLIAERWPRARVTGVDASPEMLAKARAIPGITWQQADLAQWRAETPADLVYSNAAFHWLDDHARLFPHLLAQVRPGGFLAVQMPRQQIKPTHLILYEVAREPAWAQVALPGLRENPVAEPADYYEWLGRDAAALDIWEVEYLQALEGDNAVLNWVLGSIARPVVDRLPAGQQSEFLKLYGERLAAAYPRRPDGRTLLPFRRLFIVAQRRG
ncbi:MAG: methyltransferase domain-containing protein [Proteobacteria bacterium]|nr:methyltransferase domain-containing protein [Pseudomonadota bacterium]